MSDQPQMDSLWQHDNGQTHDTAQADPAFAYDDARYPAAFFADYEALACLACTGNAETLLVRERKTGAHFLAKCYLGENRSYGMTEASLLRKVSHPGIPRYVAAYENDAMLCVVRAYIEGLPLNEYAAETRPSPEQAVRIASQICDILSYLHNLNPPIIHRDIKPQNIIIDAEARAWLIDFGISREYNAAAAKDTQYFGTVDFAPPEQYGFSQTDNRTDIFSLGVLIGWLLTGESQPRKALPKLDSPRLQKIVKTCTELTPERRYSSAELVKKALLHADGHVQRRALRAVLCLLSSLVLLCAGFAVGRYSDFSPALFAPGGVSFQEPLIEQAVRQTLNLSADAPVSESDLLSVTEIYIFGNTVAADLEAYSAARDRMVAHDPAIQNGGIRTLEDLAKLRRLKILRIALQDITDLSPLAELDDLELVELNHNPIESVSPLAGLYSLRELSVYATRVSDLSPLASCPLLVNIEAGNTRITAPEAFASITSLQRLSLRQTTLSSLEGIGALSGLEQIALGAVRDRNLAQLLSLPLLREVSLNEDQRAEAERDLAGAAFQISFS